ncbi:hypothetical protein ACQKEY_00650 [Lysinibacillus fusiformis]|uniref:hypothetical protein n=1 Tax=Lysinibacillus fusiformis TaxID=28031 RepID=UPI003D03688C
MLEFNRNSKIIDLVNSQKSLKALGWMLTIRDTTVKEVFNALGYYYDFKIKRWINSTNVHNPDLTFQQALELIRENKPRKQKIKKAKATKNVGESNNCKFVIEALNVHKMQSNEFYIYQELKQEIFDENLVEISEGFTKIRSEKNLKRKNRTFYIDEELMKDILELAKNLNVKISHLVEIALVEMLDKYSK